MEKFFRFMLFTLALMIAEYTVRVEVYLFLPLMVGAPEHLVEKKTLLNHLVNIRGL